MGPHTAASETPYASSNWSTVAANCCSATSVKGPLHKQRKRSVTTGYVGNKNSKHWVFASRTYKTCVMDTCVASHCCLYSCKINH